MGQGKYGVCGQWGRCRCVGDRYGLAAGFQGSEEGGRGVQRKDTWWLSDLGFVVLVFWVVGVWERFWWLLTWPLDC